jgi:anti-anti-sigma factor
LGNWLVAETLHNESHTLVHLVGEIDIATLPDVRLTLAPQIRPASTVVVDLAGVTFLSAAGARLLAEAHEDLRSLGGRLLLWRPHPAAERTLQLAYPGMLTIRYGPVPN